MSGRQEEEGEFEQEQQPWTRRRENPETPTGVPLSSGEDEDLREGEGAAGRRGYYGKGLDASLQKHEPSTAHLSAANNRNFRRKLDIYCRTCRGRGVNCMREAAYSTFASLSVTHFELSESMSLGRIDNAGLQYVG